MARLTRWLVVVLAVGVTLGFVPLGPSLASEVVSPAGSEAPSDRPTSLEEAGPLEATRTLYGQAPSNLDPYVDHQRAKLDLAEALLALDDSGQFEPADRFATGVAVAERATETQREILGLGVAEPVPLSGYERPSRAVVELVQRHEVGLVPADRAAIEGLDDLPEPVRGSLAELVDAFLAMETAAREAYAEADRSVLRELQANRHDALSVPDGTPGVGSPWPPGAGSKAGALGGVGTATDLASPPWVDPVAPTAAPTVSDGEARPPSEVLEEAGVDLAPVLATRTQFLDAVHRFHQALEAMEPGSEVGAPLGVEACPAFALDLEGLDRTYEEDCALVVDVGGEDRFHNNAGGANLARGDCELFSAQPAPAQFASAALISLGTGDDEFGNPSEPRGCGVNGGGTLGAGFLIAEGGENNYVGGSIAVNGGGSLGAGFLLDLSPSDVTYEARHSGTNGGASFGGLGILINVDGESDYLAGRGGTNGGAELGAAGTLISLGGVDQFRATKGGTNGGGSHGGSGFLFASDGGRFEAGPNGANGGGRTGSGLLLNAGGDALYDAGSVGANGGTHFGGTGTLFDLGGNDTYLGGGSSIFVRSANGASAAGGFGLLYDAQGSDFYRDGELEGLSCWDCSRIAKGSGPGFQIDVDDTPDRRVEAACEDREEHPPIRITEDHGPRGFTWTNPVTGEAEPRPGSGVTGGSGTAEDPFVIDGWCFAAPEGHGASPVAAPAVLVNGTQAHVVVEDNGFTGGTAERVRKQVGVHLEATRNVAVRSNAFAHVRTGVLVEGGQGGLVEENTVRFGSIAVEVRGAEQVRVEGNRLVNHLAGVLGEEAPGLVVASNEVRRMFHGVHVNASPGVHLAGNVLEDSVEYGGYVIRSRGAVLEGNLAVDHGDTGLVLGVSSDQAEVSGNTLRANGDAGLLVHDSDGVRVVENWMEANGVGVQVRDTAEALELRGNNLEDSREGVGVDASETELAVDARANWWGCPDGPGRDGCDGVNGDVVVDPWLTEPNPDAGAG